MSGQLVDVYVYGAAPGRINPSNICALAHALQNEHVRSGPKLSENAWNAIARRHADWMRWQRPWLGRERGPLRRGVVNWMCVDFEAMRISISHKEGRTEYVAPQRGILRII